MVYVIGTYGLNLEGEDGGCLSDSAHHERGTISRNTSAVSFPKVLWQQSIFQSVDAHLQRLRMFACSKRQRAQHFLRCPFSARISYRLSRSALESSELNSHRNLLYLSCAKTSDLSEIRYIRCMRCSTKSGFMGGSSEHPLLITDSPDLF